MKKIIFLFLFIFSMSLSAQNLKITYKAEAKLGKTRNSVKENFLLSIQGHKSVFISENKIITDSLFSKYYQKVSKNNSHAIRLDGRSPEMNNIRKYKSKISFIIEKDFEKNQLRFQNKAFMSIIQYTQKLPVLKWQLQDSVKSILGYPVQKAVLHYKGRDYTAWYTPEIPISDGPYKFWGLPGLILEIYDARKDYSFIIKGIEKSGFYPENIFAKSSTLLSLIKTTEKDYLKTFYKTFNANAVMGTTVVIGQDSDEYARERVDKLRKAYNNPIELE